MQNEREETVETTEEFAPETKKMDIKETKEVFEFCDFFLGDLIKYKSDDGKIDLTEWGLAAVKNAPGAVTAFVGYDKIDDEIKDLDDAEKQQLAVMGISLMKKVVELVQAKKES